MDGQIVYVEDKRGNIIFPVTGLKAVVDSTGKTLEEILKDFGSTGGLVIKGSVESVSELPYEGQYNDCYYVGENIYLWVGPGNGDTNTPNNAWKNKGTITKGDKGDTGDAAHFNNITASIDNVTGDNPSVEVTQSGPDTAKNLDFIFHQIKGPRGVSIQSIEQTSTSQEPGGTNTISVSLDDGSTANFYVKNGEAGVTDVTASVDSTTGNPEVVVNLDNGLLNLAFYGLKGIQGNPGTNNASMVLVNELPQASSATLENVYLVYNDQTEKYDRYFTQFDGVDYSWVQAGDLDIDLGDYQRKDDEIWLTREAFDALEVKDITKVYNVYEEDEEV